MKNMKITKENTEMGLVPVNSREDHHWVEKLFPPHFTLENLLENQNTTSEKHFTGTEEPQRGQRRQIYLTALKEVQHMERMQKKEAMTNKTIRQEGSVNTQYSEQPTPDQRPHYNESKDEKEMCIWNEMDIGKLRAGFAEMTKDRCKLMHKLNCAEEQLKEEREQKRRLQGLVEELEEKLSLASKKAARQSLMMNDLRTEKQNMNAQLHKLDIEVREKQEEIKRYRTSVTDAKEDVRKSKEECFRLAWELDRIQAQQRTERDGLETVAQIEHEAALLKLKREMEQMQIELRAERDSHARSRAALDLLRKHFSSQ